MGLLRSSLPAITFFALLGGAVAAGYWLGTAHHDVDRRIYSCSMHPQVQHEGPGLCPICHMALEPRDAITHDEGGAIAVDPVVVQNMGVRIAAVDRGPLARELRLFGQLAVPQDRVRDIALRFPAFVERVYANRDGMEVAKGAPLLSVYAPEVTVAAERMLAAKRSNDAAAVDNSRARLLRWDVPTAAIEAMLAADAVPRALEWPSPIQGVVLERRVVDGGALEAGATALRLADLSTLWLEAQVPAGDAAGVKVGDEAKVALQGQTAGLDAKVAQVLPTVDAAARTLTVRFEVPNARGDARPGMFASIRLRGATVADALRVPYSAVLDTGTRTIAFVALGNGRFEARDVQLGVHGDDDLVEVQRGLAQGEPVVVSGQFLLAAESRLRDSTRKLSEQGLLGGGALPAPAAIVTLDDTAQQALDRAVQAYLAVQTTLAADRPATTEWQTLQGAVEGLPATLPEPVRGAAAALREAVRATPADLPAMRTSFQTVSKAAIDLVTAARPSAAVGAELSVMYCSMVPASWLQSGTKLRNPYYGAAMLECGERTRTLPSAAGAKR